MATTTEDVRLQASSSLPHLCMAESLRLGPFLCLCLYPSLAAVGRKGYRVATTWLKGLRSICMVDDDEKVMKKFRFHIKVDVSGLTYRKRDVNELPDPAVH